MSSAISKLSVTGIGGVAVVVGAAVVVVVVEVVVGVGAAVVVVGSAAAVEHAARDNAAAPRRTDMGESCTRSDASAPRGLSFEAVAIHDYPGDRVSDGGQSGVGVCGW